MGSRPHLSFCACKTARFAPEILVSMAPSPHLWIFQVKQRLLDKNYKSLWVPDLTCRFVHSNSVIITRITSLYGFQPSSMVLCIQNSVLRTKLHVSIGPRPHLRSSACKTACLASELLVSMGPSPHLWVLYAKHRLLDQNNKSLWVPDMNCPFVHVQQRA